MVFAVFQWLERTSLSVAINESLWAFAVVEAIHLLALLNAVAFHFGIEKKLVNWDTSPGTPGAAKLAGASSMALWAITIVFGRFIAYNWFAPL